jgi:hypothetical protein
VDVSSFTAGADYRIYAATMTGFTGGSADTLKDVIASDGTTVLEADDEDGAIGSASSIAGTVPATAGTYYVRQFIIASLPGTIRPYDIYMRVRSGSPVPEMEPNDKDVPEVPRSNDWRNRVIEPGTAKDDTFAITVNGGDTIGVIVDADLERGAPEWNVIAGTGVFTGSFIIRL